MNRWGQSTKRSRVRPFGNVTVAIKDSSESGANVDILRIEKNDWKVVIPYEFFMKKLR